MAENSYRDSLSTNRDTLSITQPRQAPPGGVFHNQDIPKISATDILKINALERTRNTPRCAMGTLTAPHDLGMVSVGGVHL